MKVAPEWIYQAASDGLSLRDVANTRLTGERDRFEAIVHAAQVMVKRGDIGRNPFIGRDLA